MWGKSQLRCSRGLRQVNCACAIVAAAALTLACVCRAEKTDVVLLINGDRITGEVKTLQQGRLSFSTDHFGTVQIEWDKIARLTSRRSYEIELLNGIRYFGVPDTIESAAPFTLAVRDEEGKVTRLESLQIVRITPLESGIAQLTQDEEFDLDLRILAGGGFGRFLLRTNQQESTWLVGLAAAREYVQSAATEDSLEGLLAAKYSLFRYDEPETSLTAAVLVLPSLSNWGRVRSEASLRLRHELVKDLFAELNLFHNYDSEPVATDVPTGDWGAVTSLGYSF